MTIQEIFNKLTSHSLEGLMVHDQLSTVYEYLGLEGYAGCHKYHRLCEFATYRKIQDYYIKQFKQVVSVPSVSNPDIINSEFYINENTELQSTLIKEEVMFLLHSWVDWENKTKNILYELYNECLSIKEFGTCQLISGLIEDVEEELEEASVHEMHKIATNFDMNEIVSEQTEWDEKFKKMISNVGEQLC